MNEGLVAVRYAKALFNWAGEKNALDKVYADVNLLEQTLEENQELKLFLESPVITASKKNDTLLAIFEAHVSSATLSLFQLVVHNKREKLLGTIARMYMQYYRQKRNIQPVQLITAIQLSDELRTTISNMVKEVYQTEVELSEKIDERIIGGFIMRIGDMQVDASIAHQLKKIQQVLFDTNVQNIN